MKSWLDKIKDPTRDVYERRYRLFVPLGIVMVFFWLVTITMLEYDLVRLEFFTVMLLAYTLSYLFAVRTGRYEIGALFGACGMVFALLPFVFFWEGGLISGAFNYCVNSLIFILVALRGRARTAMLVADFTVATGCFIVSGMNPGLVHEVSMRVSYWNTYTEMVITSIMAASMMAFQLFAFQQERDMMEKQKQEVEDMNRGQNRFFSSMSHEIRTPINTIIGMNELIMRDATLSDEGVEKARSVDSASKMLLALINDILDVSKMESGKMDIVPVEYETANMLAEVTGMISGRAAGKGLLFHVDVDESLPSRLFGDEVRIKQVLVNLLSNSVKYTKQGSVTMSVQGDRTDDNRVVLTVRVEDTGMGIKKEAIPQLFEAFKRVDEEKNRNIEGTGLGLSIVKQIVDLMNGEIGVSSVYTKGSTFTVALPQEIVDDTPVGEIALRTQGAGKGREYYKQRFEAPDAKLLIVDDNEMNLIVEKGLLSETKIAVDTALSGENALKMTRDTVYDVIFMDHLMPEMDGIECLKRIREQEGGMNRETPVIALTANAGSENQALYVASGFNGYLLKPVSGAQLEETLLRALPEGKVNVTGAATMQSDTDSVFGKLGRKKRVAVTMDSGCDLPKEWIDRFEIGVASSLIETDHGTFRDNTEIDSNELMGYMENREHHAKSHPPTVEQFERLFGMALSKAQSVVHIALAEGVSDSYKIACEAAKAFDNVTVVDSGSITGGAGMMAVYAAYQAESGRSAEEVLFNLKLVKPQIHATFALENGDFLARGGRIAPWVNAVLDAFLLHPVIELRNSALHTKVIASSAYRRRYIRKTLLRYRAVDTSLLFLCYVGLSEQELRDIREEIDRTLKFARVVVMSTSGAVAVNSGPGSFGLIYRTFGNDRETGKPLYTFLPEEEKETAAVFEDEEEEMVTPVPAPAAPVVPEPEPDPALVIDEAAGILNCGSKEAYEGVKKMFAESAKEKAAEIERYFEAEDWENYTIKVHALKSSARLIGAMNLSDRAKDLEACGNTAKS